VKNSPFLFSSSFEDHITDSIICLNGSLIFDSAEADLSFWFRCQDRYLLFASLLGDRSLFFVKNDQHREQYIKSISQLRKDFKSIQATQDIWQDGRIPEPLYAQLDIELFGSQHHLVKLFPDDIGNKQLLEIIKIRTNQVSPTYFKLLRDLKSLLLDRGVDLRIDRGHVEDMEQKIMLFNDKAFYVDLISRYRGDLPKHVDTALLNPEKWGEITTWDELVLLIYPIAENKPMPSSIYVKSSLDSGGNGAVKFTKEEFDKTRIAFDEIIRTHILANEPDTDNITLNLQKVLADSATFNRCWTEIDASNFVKDFIDRRRKLDISLLIQTEIKKSANRDLPFGIGINCYIKNRDEINIVAIAGQLYSDRDCKIHIGAHLSNDLRNKVLTDSFEKQIIELCRCFAEEGYIGPIGFDACLENESYTLIYDCNPRCTAILPALVIKSSLELEGYEISQIINIDYRGRFVFPNFIEQLNLLKKKNLLFHSDHPSGILLLPNLARKNGYDAFFINNHIEEVNEILDSMILGDGGDVDKGELTQLFY